MERYRPKHRMRRSQAHQRSSLFQERRASIIPTQVKELAIDPQELLPATKEDIRARRQYQFERYLSLGANNQLTPQWKSFGEKHQFQIQELRKAQHPET